MAEYLNDLPEGANLGSVFGDLHSRASGLIQEIDKIRIEGYGGEEEANSRKPVPGTELSVNWGWVRGNSAGGYFTTHIYTSFSGGRDHHLLAAGSFRHDEGLDPEPSRVSANRGDELGGDYSMRQNTSDESNAGLITVSLRDMGVRVITDEPTGDTTRPPQTLIETFLADEGVVAAERLKIVTKGILDGITMVEMIRDGTPAEEVLAMMDRIPERSAA